MKKSSISGWQDVFTFTLKQTFKNKAFIICFVILIVLSALSVPLINMISSAGEEDMSAPSPVTKVYVNNETTLPDMNFSELLKDERMSHIDFETMQEDYEVVSNRIETEENDSVILTIGESQGMYSLSFVKAAIGSIKDSNMQLLSTAVSEQFESFRIDTLGITEDQTTMLHASVVTKVTTTDVNGAPIIKEDTSISFTEYWFLYGILFIVLMVNVMAGTQIATSIVTEKSTRVLEYLLISVKPLALMVGKTLAMLLAVLIQMISMVVVLFLSNTVSSLFSTGSSESIMAQYIPKNIFQNLNILNIVLCFLLIMLGMLFYATLAGLTGATVSKLEEVGEGLMLFTFTNVIGAYVAMGASGVLMGPGVNGYVIFTFLFPLSSPFILPGAILAGKASLPIVGAAIVLLIVSIILLFKFVAKVFETLILHNGNKIKVSELLKLSKTV